MVGGAKGVIRTMLCNGEHRSEVIPVDIAINGLIAIAYKIATTKEKWVEIVLFILFIFREKRNVIQFNCLSFFADRWIFQFTMWHVRIAKNYHGVRCLIKAENSITNIHLRVVFGGQAVIWPQINSSTIWNYSFINCYQHILSISLCYALDKNDCKSYREILQTGLEHLASIQD